MSEPSAREFPSAAARLGQVISGRYRILELLGEGGMGAVYLAEHTLMRKRVALKLLHPEVSEDEEILARFKREAEAAAHIEHPNVASATDFGQTEDGAFFLVLEYVEGTSLRDALANAPLAASRALHIARQIALALERAHAAGIVHRDLKPENIMLVKKGEDPDFVKVLDFGIARLDPSSARGTGTREPLTRLGTILGTPEYMAPEQGAGDVVGPTGDLYSVGVMLYEMLTGLRPFDGAGMEIISMHIVAPVPAMSERAPAVRVDPAIESIVRKLLEKETTNRYPNARAVADAIEVTAHACGIELGGTTPASFVRDSGPSVDAFAKTSIGERVPSLRSIRTPRKLPLALIIGAPAVFVILVVILVVTLRSVRTSTTMTTIDGGTVASSPVDTAPPAKSKTATPAEIQTARQRGTDALAALVKDFPNDPQVHRMHALVLAEKGRAPDALKAIRAMLALGPDGVAAVDSELTSVVVGAAGLPSTTDEAFALLEGPLGPSGVDALVDMAQMKSSPTLAKRATRSLSKPEVRAKASPAAAILLDLKAAKTCAAKHDLLERAKTDGDARLLGVLGPMKDQRGCGFAGLRDCWSCLRKDTALDDAIATIQARSSK
jgi:eukaryotic-like serine/threonine-protein kinase